MKATFLGYSSFVSKKSNNPVLLVSIAYLDRSWVGYKVSSSFIDNSLLPDIKALQTGDEVDVDVDFSGRIISISSLPSSESSVRKR